MPHHFGDARADLEDHCVDGAYTATAAGAGAAIPIAWRRARQPVPRLHSTRLQDEICLITSRPAGEIPIGCICATETTVRRIVETVGEEERRYRQAGRQAR
jgi:hypothetical protein